MACGKGMTNIPFRTQLLPENIHIFLVFFFLLVFLRHLNFLRNLSAQRGKRCE